MEKIHSPDDLAIFYGKDWHLNRHDPLNLLTKMSRTKLPTISERTIYHQRCIASQDQIAKELSGAFEIIEAFYYSDHISKWILKLKGCNEKHFDSFAEMMMHITTELE